MKIKYVHWENPETEKEVNVEDLYKRYQSFHRSFFPEEEMKTKEEWWKGELERLEKKVKKGIILSYRIVEEGEGERENGKNF